MRRLTIAVILTAVATWGCDGFTLPDGLPFINPGADTGIPGINPAEPAGQSVPELGEPVSLQIINESGTDAGVQVRFLVGEVEVRQTILLVPAGRIMDTIGPDLATRVEIQGLYVTGDPTPTIAWLLGQDFQASDLLQYILRGPGEITDECPDDPDKTEPGLCGCGTPDTDTDGDGSADCLDGCPDDPDKTAPGVCDCGIPDVDDNKNGEIDCIESPSRPSPPAPPADRDQDGIPDSQDNCPDTPNPEQGDYDKDGVGDACDNCSGEYNPDQANADGDQYGDYCDPCPKDPLNDADTDGLCADQDPCPNDPFNDADADGVCGDLDQCPNTIPGAPVDEVGCPNPPVLPDFDRDGDVDMDDFAMLQSCFSGSGVPQEDPDCAAMDLDGDGDVDGTDVWLFIRCFSGTNILADPACRDCNANGLDDRDDLLNCPPTDPDCADCNTSGLPDSCDIAEDISDDLNVNRVPDECEPQACCSPSDGTCQDLLPESCAYSGGISQGLDSTCQTVTCYTPPLTEACCINDVCMDLDTDDCSSQQGLPQGPGTNCATVTCGPPPDLGACCLFYACEILTESECNNLEGHFLGPGSSCDQCCPFFPNDR